MKNRNRFSSLLAILILFCLSCPVLALDKKDNDPWSGVLKDGKIIYENDLEKILEKHLEWYLDKSKSKDRFLDLLIAFFPEKISWRADSKGDDLLIAILKGDDLRIANLKEAKLGGANLKRANLVVANLQEADLREANLQEADLRGANLQGAKLGGANLQGAKLVVANLQGADLRDANLQEAKLRGANLQGADLRGANLQGAKLRGANLQGVKLNEANLQWAFFELESGAIPDILSIAQALNISGLRYSQSPHSLIEIRNEFKKNGLREQEREITYAIKHSGFENALGEEGNYTRKIQVCLGWFFFEITSEWGMAPERPLYIMFAFIFIFTGVYYVSLVTSSRAYKGPSSPIKTKKDGIWKIWIPERMRQDFGKNKPELLTLSGWEALRTAFYFSTLSAFNIGWRDLNVGNWLTRIQPKEYRFQASGWVRSFSGFQSILSVYLLALWVLTYFGRPFESY